MKKNKIAALLSLALVFTGVQTFISAFASTNTYTIDASNSPVDYHTPDEIAAFYAAHPFSRKTEDTYAVNPSLKNETPGKLSEASVNNALNSLNFLRYIAGIPADVYSSDAYEEMAMAGTTLLTKENKLTHTPNKPASVSDSFYELAYAGTSSSNIAMGYNNLAEAIVEGWIDDSDPSNIDLVGHRRWLLNPAMGAIGFGNTGSFTAMYSFDNSNAGSNPDMVLWPALNAPVEYFTDTWSISFDDSLGLINDISSVTIKLKSEQTGQEYTITGNDRFKSGKYMNIDTGSYGMGPALIFTPDVRFKAGDNVTVSITGLKGLPYDSIQYTVHFFALNPNRDPNSEHKPPMQQDGFEDTKKEPLEGISIKESSLNMEPGQTITLDVRLQPQNALDVDVNDVIWTSSNPSVISIDNLGFITAVSTGTATVTAELKGFKASCTINVRPAGTEDAELDLPDYVVKGNWGTSGLGNWTFTDAGGRMYMNQWAAIYNPYADKAKGQENFDWFYFEKNGQMKTGWLQQGDGTYYLNEASDGTRGKMVTGWCWIEDQYHVERCYYFNPNSDGQRGKLLTNTTIDGHTVDANGAWTVNGVVQENYKMANIF
ncbi:MAG: Ig-like domain-containing protein [Eubacteriales bacterium]|nr:Ig-like domain-containing protein [Eubacteriales bacterium]